MVRGERSERYAFIDATDDEAHVQRGRKHVSVTIARGDVETFAIRRRYGKWGALIGGVLMGSWTRFHNQGDAPITLVFGAIAAGWGWLIGKGVASENVIYQARP